jgi:mono/diheme cytochrome c family protein
MVGRIAAVVGGLLVGTVVWAGLGATARAQTPAPSVVVERTDYDMKRVVAPSVLSETELEGRRLLVQRCAYCHDPGSAAAPWLDQERIKTVGEESFREKILKGSRRMPGWQYALSRTEIDQIMAYLKTVTPDQRPARPGGR